MAALFGMLLGAVVLLGWTLGADPLKSVFPGLVTVTLAEDGLEALAVMREAAQSGKPIQSVVADMNMPGLTGVELGAQK